MERTVESLEDLVSKQLAVMAEQEQIISDLEKQRNEILATCVGIIHQEARAWRRVYEPNIANAIEDLIPVLCGDSPNKKQRMT